MNWFLIASVFLPSLCSAFDWSLTRQVRTARAAHAYEHREYAKAQEQYERLVVDAPRDYDAVLGLANTLYAQEHYEQALSYYQMLGHDSTMTCAQQEHALFNAGCAQVRVHQLREALASFEAVVALNQNNARAQKNIALLKKMVAQPPDKKSSKKQAQQSGNQQPTDASHNQSQHDKQDDKRQRYRTNAHDHQGQGDNADKQEDAIKNQANQPRNTNKAQQQDQSSPDDKSTQPQATRSTHDQSPHGSCQQYSQRAQPAQPKLDKQAQEILREVAGVEKDGYRLYVQAQAGQRAEQEHAYAW